MDDYLLITNPEFNEMSSELLKSELCVLLSDWENDSVVFEFYYLN